MNRINFKNSRLIFLWIIGAIFLLRLPTLFVEYYDIDVLTSFIAAKSKIQNEEYIENKGIVYHWILNQSFSLLGESYRSFHFVGILLVIFTSLFIYLLAKQMFCEKTGLLAAALYGIYISAFNRQFMAINGEIVYNLFFSAAFYYFYLFFFQKKYWTIPLLLVSLVLAAFTKFQGIWATVGIFLFVFFIHPFFIEEPQNRKKYGIFVFVFFIISLIFITLDFFYFKILLNDSFFSKISSMYAYIATRGFDPLFFIVKFLHRFGFLSIMHSLIWIGSLVFLIRFFKQRDKKEEHAYLVVLFFILFFSFWLSGIRLYFHYFMQVYPVIAIMAASVILPLWEQEKWKKKLKMAFLIPVLFFFVWNTKDALIVQFFPQAFYKEGKFLYHLRLILVGQDNDYLLPHPTYVEALDYLKKNAHPEEKIFVWPVGAEFIYFSGLKPAYPWFWNEDPAVYALEEEKRGNPQVKIQYQKDFQIFLEKIQADYFIDISTSPVIYFKKYGHFTENFPEIHNFLKKNYIFVGIFGQVKIWKKSKG